MKNNPNTPSNDESGRHAESRLSMGNQWNNGISRRSFLKRTGGATLATLITWHGLTETSHAEEAEGEAIVVKISFTIPNGESFIIPGMGASTPDNHTGYMQWANNKVTKKVKSSDDVSEWMFENEPELEVVEGFVVAWGPQTVTFYRTVNGNPP